MGSARQHRRARVLFLAAVTAGTTILGGPAGVASAASGTWAGATSGTWGDPSMWVGGSIADGTDALATFTADVPATDLTVHLDSARTVGGLTFSDTATATAGNWLVDNNGNAANVLTFGVTSGTPTITVGAMGTGNGATISASLAGTQGLSKAGTGALTLTGADTFTGNWTVTGGTLTLATGGSVNAGSVTTSNSGTRLVVNGGSLTASGSSTINNSGSSGGLLVSSGSATFSVLQTNASTDGGLITVNGGTLTAATLNIQRSSNTGNSDTTPTSGQTSSGLYVNGASASVNVTDLKVSTANAGATARMDAGTFTVANSVVIGGQNNSGAVRWGILDVNGGTFTVNGAAGITIGADAADHADRDVLLVRNGTVTTEQIAFGDLPTLTSGRGVLSMSGGSLYVGAGGIVKNGAFTSLMTLSGGTLGAKADWSTSQAITLSGTTAVIKAADAAGVAHAITLNGDISGSGGALTKDGGGTLYLGGNNSYTGGTNVLAGSVVGSAAQIRGNVVNNGNVTFAQPTDVTYSNAITGSGSVTKTGSGNMIFSAAQAYTGPTSVTGGSLRLTGANATSGVTVGNGAGLATSGGGATVNALTFGSSAGDSMSLNVNDGTGISPVTVTGTDALVANGTTAISVGVAGITHTGPYTLIDYSGSIGGAGFGGFTLAALPPRVSGTLVNNTANTSVDFNVTNIDFPVWTGAVAGGAWDVNTTPNWKEFSSGNATTYLETNTPGDQVLFDDSATGTTAVQLNTTVTPTLVTFQNNTLSYSISGSGKITGPTGLIKSGTGNLTLANTGGNDFTGTTAIQAGTLTLGSGNALSPSSTLNVSAGATLDMSNNGATSGPLTLSGNIVGGGSLNAPSFNLQSGTVATRLTGAGNLTKTTAGTVVLTANNDYTGSTSLQAGQVTLGTDNALPQTTTLTMGSSSATPTLDTNDRDLTIGRLNSASSSTGSSVTNSSANPKTLTLNGGDVNQSGSSSYSGSIDGNLGVLFASSGTLTLSGTNSTYTGGTTLNFGGTLVISGDRSLGAVPATPTTNLTFTDFGPETLRANATDISLDVNRNINLNFVTLNVDTNGSANTMTINGVIAGGFLNKVGNGTLVLTNPANSFDSPTISAGALRITSNTALGAGTVTVGSASLQLGDGVTFSNGFSSTSSSADNQIDVPIAGATATFASTSATATSGNQIRLAATGAGATLLFTGSASLSNTVVINQGNIVFQGSGSLSASGSGLIGRPGGGTQTVAVTLKDNANVHFGGTVDLGNARSVSAATITVQDAATWSNNTTFNLLDTTAATASSTINLNGGSFTTGPFLKTSNGAGQTATINFNGGTLRPAAASTAFLPAFANTAGKVQNGGAIIDTNSFDVTIGLPLTADTGSTGGLTKNGAGALTLGALDVAGPVTVNAGQVNLSAAARFASLAYLTGTKLDAGTSRMVLTGTSDAALLAALSTGRNGGTWDGDGIVSSAAAADPNHITGIGWAHASDLGVSAWDTLAGVNPTDIVTRYTYTGDLNLDGVVNGDDLALLDRGFAKHLTGWINGDVDYSGSVTPADYLMVDTAYGKQSGALSPDFLAMRQSEFGSDYVAALTAAVPEPASLAACGFALLPLLTRRRRRRTA